MPGLFFGVLATFVIARASEAIHRAEIQDGLLPRFDEKQHSTQSLKHRDVFQQGDHAEDDDDDPYNLFGAAIERQQVDQIKNENDDEKCDQCTDKHPDPPPETS
jgi:hypothetical protein